MHILKKTDSKWQCECGAWESSGDNHAEAFADHQEHIRRMSEMIRFLTRRGRIGDRYDGPFGIVPTEKELQWLTTLFPERRAIV